MLCCFWGLPLHVSAGVRGPTALGAALAAALAKPGLKEVGSADDAHGGWLFATAVDDDAYVSTLGTQKRFLSPGLAVVSQAAPGGVPGKFVPWSMAPAAAHLVLVSPLSLPRPALAQPAVTALPGGSQMVRLAWGLPVDASMVQQFRLYVAADPAFNELLRQPDAAGLSVDLAGSTRSVDVLLPGRRTPGSTIYVSLLACNDKACSRSCTGQFVLP